jgi:membrane protein required for colicin V production
MQAYDLIMLIVLGMSTIFGAIKGLAWQVASLASIVVSYFVAYRYRFQVAEMIEAKPPWNMFLAMLLLFVGTSFVIWVAFRLMSGFIDRIRLKDFDRHLGAVFGFGKGLIFCLLITMFAMTLLGPAQQAAICQSRSGFAITAALDKGLGVLPSEIHEVVGPYLARLDDQLRQHRVEQEGDDPSPIDFPQVEFPPVQYPMPDPRQQPNLQPSGLRPAAGFSQQAQGQPSGIRR